MKPIVRTVLVRAALSRLYCPVCDTEMKCVYSGGSPRNCYHEHQCPDCGHIEVMTDTYPAISLGSLEGAPLPCPS
jgi:hypothetical protein